MLFCHQLNQLACDGALVSDSASGGEHGLFSLLAVGKYFIYYLLIFGTSDYLDAPSMSSYCPDHKHIGNDRNINIAGIGRIISNWQFYHFKDKSILTLNISRNINNFHSNNLSK